jgi:hypothetical protein
MGLISQPLVVLGTGRRSGSSAWARRLCPTLADFFFVALLVWLFVAGSFGWMGLLADGDTGWHIRAGEWVLDNQWAPTRDLFSFSKPGETWYAWEWLADLFFAMLYRQAGLKGVVLAAAVILTATSFVVLRAMLWRGANPLVAVAVCLLGVGCSSVHYLARPHIFTLLLMAVSVWMLSSDRQRPTGRVWLLIPLTALWANLHGGFVALIAMLGLTAAGSAAEAWLEPAMRGARLRSARRYALLAGGCLAASLVNPFGYHLHAPVVTYLKSDWIRKSVEEFQSPSFRDETMLQFEILLIAGLFVAAAAARRRRVVEALWILLWTHAALGSVRHVSVYVVVATPLIAAGLTRVWERAAAGCSRDSVVSILKDLGDDSAPGFRRVTAWAAVPVLALVVINEPLKWPNDFPKERFPVNLVNRHGESLAGARVFTSDQWADYLIFRSYPRQRVFFDGRSDFYGPEIGQQYLRIVQVHFEWEQLLDRHRFDYVLSPPDWPLASMLKRDRRWRIVEDDGRGILFERIRSKRKVTWGQREKSAPDGLMEWSEAAESTRGDHRG